MVGLVADNVTLIMGAKIYFTQRLDDNLKNLNIYVCLNVKYFYQINDIPLRKVDHL